MSDGPHFAVELVLVLGSMWAVALIVATAIERYRKRKDDEAWVDALIARHREDLRRRYANGQFKPKDLWKQP